MKLVRIMWIPVLVVMLYTGWILWQRHLSLQPAPPAPMTRSLGEIWRPGHHRAVLRKERDDRARGKIATLLRSGERQGSAPGSTGGESVAGNEPVFRRCAGQHDALFADRRKRGSPGGFGVAGYYGRPLKLKRFPTLPRGRGSAPLVKLGETRYTPS